MYHISSFELLNRTVHKVTTDMYVSNLYLYTSTFYISQPFPFRGHFLRLRPALVLICLFVSSLYSFISSALPFPSEVCYCYRMQIRYAADHHRSRCGNPPSAQRLFRFRDREIKFSLLLSKKIFILH